MIITIGGRPLSGKGSAGKLLAQTLGFEYRNIGDVWKAEATRQGMTPNEFHAYLKDHPDYDRQIDAMQTTWAADDNIIVDSRLSFYFIGRAAPEKTVRIYVTVDPQVAAQRRYADAKRTQLQTLEAAHAENKNRARLESEQHLALYGVDSHDTANFDVIVDSSSMTPEQVVQSILAKLPT